MRNKTPASWTRRHFTETSSTQDEALRLVRDCAPIPTIITAEQQTAGRGRQGRTWLSPEGGLYFSLVIPATDVPEHNCGLLPLIAGLASADACAIYGIAAEIKWPNDVMVDGRKIAGILCEAGANAEHLSYYVVGVGINIMESQLETATSFATESTERAVPDKEDLLEIWLDAFARRLRGTDTVAAIDQILYGRYAPALHEGRKVILLGVAQSGALRVESGEGRNGIEEIIAGEVILGRVKERSFKRGGTFR